MYNQYLIYYHDASSNKFYICEDVINKKNVMKKKCRWVNVLPNECNQFEFESTKKGLVDKYIAKHGKKKIIDFVDQCVKPEMKEYSTNICIWRDQLLTSKARKIKYDYFDNTFKTKDKKIFYRTHQSNTTGYFNFCISAPVKEIISKFEDWCDHEIRFYEGCKCGALYRYWGECDETYNVVTNDFSASYPAILGSKLSMYGEIQQFETPTVAGFISTYKLKNIGELSYGIYRCKVTCTMEKFAKLFQFNADNYYTHYELNFFGGYDCFEYENLGECLLYEKVINGDHIWGAWYNNIIKMKGEMPGNKLVKKLSSSIWGHLSGGNYMNLTNEQLESDEYKDIKLSLDKNRIEGYTHLCVKTTYKYNEDSEIQEELFKMQNIKQPYKTNYRLKPFIVAFQRIQLYKIILDVGISKVLRCHTDSVTFNADLLKEKDIKKLNAISGTFTYEAKSSGMINYKNGLDYKHV